jgi:aspartyl-tRNA(Asn)/glutamyl-tRNA(Gln) amidotransferase subunit A
VQPHRHDIQSAGRALRAGTVSSVGLVRTCLAAIARGNGQLKVMVAVFEAEALAAAERADAELAAGTDRGALHGIPVAIKDVIAVRETPTRGGGNAWSPDWHPQDAESVARLRAAGAVVIGKTHTMEFACGMPDRRDGTLVTVNPWRDGRWAGGSSSGAAAGLAAGMFLGALGTDTGGSIRCPAAWCGVSGIKPTYGLVPTEGCIPWAFSLDHIGPLARTARDCALMLEALTGEVAPPAPAALSGARIGVIRAAELTSEPVHPGVEAAFDQALEQLTAAGTSLRPARLPLYEDVCNAAMLITPAEGYAYHRENLRARWHDYGRQTRVQIASGAVISAADYVQARRIAERAKKQVAALLDDVDLLVLPTSSTPAPDIESLYGGDLRRLITGTIFTPYFDVTGNPAMSVPMGFADGLPAGLQVVGRHGQDFAVLAAGAAFQELTDWHQHVPDESLTAA